MTKLTLSQDEIQDALSEALQAKQAEAYRNTIHKDIIKICNKAKKLGVGFSVTFRNTCVEPEIYINGGYLPLGKNALDKLI